MTGSRKNEIPNVEIRMTDVEPFSFVILATSFVIPDVSAEHRPYSIFSHCHLVIASNFDRTYSSTSTSQYFFTRSVSELVCATIMASLPEKPSASPPGTGVPKAVVSRLSYYLRELQNLMSEGTGT